MGRHFSLRHRVQTRSEAQSASHQMVLGALSLGAERSGRESDHSPPSISDFKNAPIYDSTLLPQYVCMANVTQYRVNAVIEKKT
jgi:hypothetical protein